jgi:hypothetical protein
MRSLSTVVVVVLVFGALLCVASSASAAPVALFQDDFEGAAYTVGTAVKTLTPPIGGSYSSANSGFVVADVSTQPLPGAGNSGKFITPAATTSMDLFANLTADAQTASTGQVVTYNMDVYVNPGSGGATGISSYAGSGYSLNIFDIYLTRDGTLKYYNNGDTTLQTAPGSYATGQWIPVQIVADMTAKTYTALVGGVVINDVFNSAADSVAKLYWYPYDVTSIDNLSITIPVPEPSTLLLLVVGVFGLLAYAWRKRK